MTTDALIDALCVNLEPVPRGAVQRRLALAVAGGGAAALLMLIALIGVRPDLAEALSGGPFWAKAGYTSSLGMAGLLLAGQLARPDRQRLRGALLLALPVALLAILSSSELAAADNRAADLVLGPRWICIPLILALAAPIYAGLLWAFRHFAPTRLWAAGAAAGLAAGGFAATIYGLYCQQVSPTYVLTRYSAAIALAALIGAIMGRRLLRW